MQIKKEEMTRTILKALTKKYIADIVSDPYRSLRNLVDLGSNFAVGEFQNKFFSTAREMLSSNKSAYYDIAMNIVSSIDQETIKTFGVNVGYNSCIHGANMIRENEAECGYNIPGTIVFSVSDADDMDGGIGCGDIAPMIAQGNELGIFTYVIACCESGIAEISSLFTQYPDSAFLLFVSSDKISDADALVDTVSGYNNVLVAVSAKSEQFADVTYKLKEGKILCGAYITYDEATAVNEILPGKYADEIARSLCPFAVLVSDYGVSETTRALVTAHVRAVRESQKAPYILIDAFQDLLEIDKIISDDACSIRFDKSGDAYMFDKKLGYNMKDAPLNRILAQTMPRKECE